MSKDRRKSFQSILLFLLFGILGMTIGVKILPWFCLKMLLFLDKLLPGTADKNVYKSLITAIIIWIPFVTSVLGLIFGGTIGILIANKVIKK